MLKTVTFLLVVLVSGSSQQCFSSNDSVPIDSEVISGLASSRYSISLSLFQYLNKVENQANVIFSPSSVHELMLLAYFGADHETEESLSKFLSLHEFLGKEDTWMAYKTQRSKISEQDAKTYPLKTANKLFFSNKLSLRSCVKENLKKEIEMIDYQTNPKWATSYINKWVEDNTDGEIKDFYDELSPDSIVAMVSAVLFKATWEKKFDPKNTRGLPFHVNSKMTKTTSMMWIIDDFFVGYNDYLKARVLKLPYTGEKQVMVIILPDNNLDEMIQKIDVHDLGQINSGSEMKKLEVEVMIPKFNDSNEIPLNDALKTFEIGNAISVSADYSRFTGRKEVYFTEVKQKAVIQVDEEGTKAAASTGVFKPLSAPITRERFICDRPFAYYIYDSFTDTILFMGTFRHPN